MGAVVSGGTPKTSVAAYWNGDVLWTTPTDITALKSRYLNNTARKITQKGLLESSAKLLPKGSLLVCTRATVGESAIADREITTNQGVKSLILKKEYDVEFLYYLISFFTYQLIRLACGSTFLELSKNDFELQRFRVPKIHEQEKIASILACCDREIENLTSQLCWLNSQKKALMQQLLSGKRRVKIDNEQPNQ